MVLYVDFYEPGVLHRKIGRIYRKAQGFIVIKRSREFGRVRNAIRA